MDYKISKLFTESVKEDIFQQIGLADCDCIALKGFESFFYKTQLLGKPCALRITHSDHRTEGEIRGEIEWMSHLHKNGLNIPRPIQFESQDFIISVTDNEQGSFHVVCFSWVSGVLARDLPRDSWNPTLFEKMGETLAKIHISSQSFEFQSNRSYRNHWEEEFESNTKDIHDVSDKAILRITEDLNRKVYQFTKSPEHYGLIHSDFHRGNFFLQNNQITVIDFDDSQFHYYAADIAIAIFYVIPFDSDEKGQNQFVKAFFESLIRGYCRINHLDRQWMSWLPALIKQRELMLYSVIKRTVDLESSEFKNSWLHHFMNDRRALIIGKKNLINLNWEVIYDGINTC